MRDADGDDASECDVDAEGNGDDASECDGGPNVFDPVLSIND